MPKPELGEARIIIETGLDRRIAEIIEPVLVAMDFKLPSSTGQRAFWGEHLDFLRIASKKKVFVKRKMKLG